jgi:heme/copper-type cytochrome/quinol oxidase subunit 3
VNIPYSIDARADTGVTNATLGMWLFIASEVMLFGSLFSSYALLRAGASTWPDQSAILNVPLAAINTVILLASSAAVVAATRAMRAASFDRFRVAFGAAIILGLLFLGVKAFEYNDELQRGLRPATNNFMGLYFTLTGLHALHIAGGLLVNGWLLTVARTDWHQARRQLTNRVKAAAMYWNFIDVIWLAIFVTLYLL